MTPWGVRSGRRECRGGGCPILGQIRTCVAVPLTDPTSLLVAYEAGDAADVSALFPLVYDELTRIAQAHRRHERDGHTLATHDLVHEAYVRLVDQSQVTWRGRAAFLALASRAMRHVLVDHARRRNAQKRGHGVSPLALDDVAVGALDRDETLLALDEALARLTAHAPDLVRLVEARFFAGMTLPEAAETLGLAQRTAERMWTKARAYLVDLLGDEA